MVLVGAAVVTKQAWDAIPLELRVQLSAASERAGAEIRARGRKESDAAVVAMQARGLTVHEMTPELQAAWDAKMQEAYPLIRGGMMPAEIFDEVQQELAAYRSRQGQP